LEAESRKEQKDQELRKALTVVIDQERLPEVANRFKDIFPALSEIPDDELLTCMSTLYSNQIVSTLFLESYRRSLEQKANAFAPEPMVGGKVNQ
jgi:hypothetical protein